MSIISIIITLFMGVMLLKIGRGNKNKLFIIASIIFLAIALSQIGLLILMVTH